MLRKDANTRKNYNRPSRSSVKRESDDSKSIKNVSDWTGIETRNRIAIKETNPTYAFTSLDQSAWTTRRQNSIESDFTPKICQEVNS